MNGQDKQSARAAQLAQVSAQIPAGKKADEHFSDALGATVEIRNVWADNLEDEMENIMRVIQEYPFVAMVSGAGSCVRSVFLTGLCLNGRTRSFLEWSLDPWVTTPRPRIINIRCVGFKAGAV